jgi:hypothetical protein
MRHQPPDTLRELCEMFPAFERWWNEEEAEDEKIDGVHLELTHHHVMMEFLGFFAGNRGAFREPELRALGRWVNRTAAEGGELAKAVTDCFLGHAREAGVEGVLDPYLRGGKRDRDG